MNGENRNVVGRAELKLAEAAAAFLYDFRGKVVLDIGSSTGGFTEYALRRGAKKVIAVEKGTKQMKAPLRYDERIKLYEKTDFLEIHGPKKGCSTRDLAKEQGRNEAELVTTLQVGNLAMARGGEVAGEVGTLRKELKEVETVLADVSFVSLTKILAKAKELVPQRADYLVMLKPQFEAYPGQLVRGVVKNERMRREIVRRFEQWLGKNGFVVIKKRDNETVGKVGGNQERFYWLRVGR